MKLALAIAAALAVVGCNKPDEESCRAAVENMRKLMGTSGGTTDITPAIRRCRSGSSKEAVACAAGAKSRAELEKCGFAHFDEVKPAPATDGSAK